MKTIKLTQGRVALVDDEDYEKVLKYKWAAIKRGYTYYATTFKKDRTPRRLRMHHLILPPKDGYVIDHKDRNGCNNQKSNLRYASNSLNAYNSKIHSHNSSGFRGVNFHKGRFRATIKREGKHIHLGYFDTKEAAAEVFQNALNEFMAQC